MPFKTLLCAVSAEQNPLELERVFLMAARLEAHVDVLIFDLAAALQNIGAFYGVYGGGIISSTPLSSSSHSSTLTTYTKELIRRAAHHSVSIAVYTDETVVDYVATTIARAAGHADLTVLVPEAGGSKDFEHAVLDGALFESGRPILLLPSERADIPDVEHILVAWNGEREAANAIHDSLGFLKRATSVHLCLVDPLPSSREIYGAEPGVPMASFLSRHGVKVCLENVPSSGRDVPEVLLQRAGEVSAGLLVMGGYGHSRFRQRIFGGTTRTILAQSEIPVLMSH